MPNKSFTIRDAFKAGEVRQLLKLVQKKVQQIEADFSTFKENEFRDLRDTIVQFGIANYNQLFNNFIQIEFINKRGIATNNVPAVFEGIRQRYVNNWLQAVSKGFATAIDSAKGLQQKIQRNLIAEIRRRKVNAIQNGIPEPTGGFFNLLLRIFGLQRARRKVARRFNLGLVQYLTMLFRTEPRNMERDMMRFLIRFFEDNLFLVTGGVVHNSASTCRFATDRVFTKRALDFIMKSPQLKVHLFHPNCRHRVVPPPKNFKGKVFDVSDLPAIAGGHFQGFHK